MIKEIIQEMTKSSKWQIHPLFYLRSKNISSVYRFIYTTQHWWLNIICQYIICCLEQGYVRGCFWRLFTEVTKIVKIVECEWNSLKIACETIFITFNTAQLRLWRRCLNIYFITCYTWLLYIKLFLVWFVWVLWHINLCRLFNAKSIFIQIISSISNNSV